MSETYYAEVQAEVERVDRQLADIRARYDSGKITVQDAARERIDALEGHMVKLRVLRDQHKITDD